MLKEKQNIIAALTASLLALGVFFGIHQLMLSRDKSVASITVGFIYDGDASTPYTANFIRAADTLQTEYHDRVKVIEKYNVPYESAEEVIRELAGEGCSLIITNSYGYGETAKAMAAEFPMIQFCEATCDNANDDPALDNYHTFMGEIYRGRYVSGVVAGAKLNEMIEQGIIDEDEAVLGYVAAYPVAEVISGYTSFLLGARSQCPSAVMRVRYTGTWTGYALEKDAANLLIDEGCVIISHHSNTIGSAIACESAAKPYTVYHVGYNQDMIDVAPTSELISCRIDWTPYILSAAEAVLADEDIESHVKGTVNGNDSGGGFAEGWVTMQELNAAAAAEGSVELIDKTIAELNNGSCHVFSGDYHGTSPDDPSDTCDLNTEYIENEHSSAPTFHYILDGIVTEDN